MKKEFALLLSLGVLAVSCTITAAPKSEDAAYAALVKGDDLRFEVEGGKRTFAKTGFVTVIPKNDTAVIPGGNCTVTDWDNYKNDQLSDVFNSRRTVNLNGFMMGKYEVTQELYEAVMGRNPCPDKENLYRTEIQRLRPVQGINWYEAVIFCNELSKKCGYDEVFTITNIKTNFKGKEKEYVSSATVTWDLSKNGFRLPTEAEWEYAARGAGKSAEEWKYKFSGSDNSKKVSWTVLTSSGYSDDDDRCRTHEVGLKKPNGAGLYDMSGNVSEWCLDWFRSVTENNDMTHGNSVPDTGNAVNPILSKGKYDNHVTRGGAYDEASGMASNWQRLGKPGYMGYGGSGTKDIGFRLVRREN